MPVILGDMVRSLFACLLALPCVALAQKQTFEVFYGGSKSGESVGEITPQGKVTSSMTLKIGPVTVSSELKGLVKDGVLSECEIETTQGPTTAKIVWKDGKVTIVQGGKEVVKDKEYKPGLKPAFSAFHPILNALLWKGFGGQAKSGQVLFIDSLAVLNTEFKSKRQQAMSSAGDLTEELWSVDLNGTVLNLAFSPEGEPLGVEVPSQKIAWIKTGYKNLFVDPLAAYPELSQPTFKIRTDRRVRAAMRDGTKLMADIVRPEKDGKYPAILIRTPYGRGASLMDSEWLAKRGYVVISQDVRGRGGSDGDWDPLVHERADGKDTLDWITQQPWSDGKVGMIGGSYLGYVQWAAASTHHPALKCIVPQVSPPEPDANFPWDHGAFMLLSNLWWCRVVKDRSSTTAGAFAPMTNLRALSTLPVTKADDKFFGSNITFFDGWAKRTTLADWGDVFTTADVASVKIPVMHVSGVWDGDGIGTAIHWTARSADHSHDWLYFGPWTHLFNTSHKYGDQEYGQHGILELDSAYLRFFDTYLKGKSVKMEEQPHVNFFVTGSNRWVKTSDWPMPGAKEQTFFLGSGSKAGSLGASPAGSQSSYTYNPNKPDFKANNVDINVTGTTTVVKKPENGKKALLFQTDPFATAVSYAGPITAELYVSSSAKDATFHLTVLDEDEKGVYRLIGLPGTRRATYADGQIHLLTPGKPVKITIEPWWFAHEFQKGHRLAIVVNSDAYPRFARNPGTGEPEWKAKRLITARQTVHTSAKLPSKITLWRLPD